MEGSISGSHVHAQVVPVPEPRISWRELSIRAGSSQPLKELLNSAPQRLGDIKRPVGMLGKPSPHSEMTAIHKDISPVAFQQFLGDGG
jgi:hypothetical protein